jgi:hypothetical protein
MRGWVYVITNKTMPGLVKVGHTLKDPDLRAGELSHTGSAGPYDVEYEVMVRDPRNIEQRAHLALRGVLADKEWFRCTVGHAVEVIRQIVGNNIILEDFRGESTSTDSSAEDIASPITVGANTAVPLRQTGTYAGNCTHCGTSFKVTLTRGENAARCPKCYRMNDATSLKHKKLFI